MKTKKAAQNASQKDAISFLKKDHREVEKAFEQFENLADGKIAAKKKLADEITEELLKHMAIEEEIFYPAVKEGIKDLEDAVNEGIVEHAGAKELIEQIQKMKGDEELFDSKVHVLSEQIEHHVEEEETEMFPKVEKSSLDLEALGQEMAKRKANL